MSLSLSLGTSLLFSLAGAPDAEAQPKKPPPKQDTKATWGKKKPGGKLDPKTAEAKRLFDEGADYYNEGNYEKAIESWEMAYELSQKELIFANLAHAYERNGQLKKALEYWRRWRAVAPPEEHAVLDTRVRNLEERVAREEKTERETAEQKKREQEEAEQARLGKSSPSGPPVLGLVLAGVGGAAIVGGLTLDIIAAGKRPDESQVCRASGDKQVCRASDRDAIESSNTLAYVGDVLLIAGGIAAAAGVVLIVTQSGSDKPKADKAEVRVVPVVTHQGAGLFVGKSF